MSVKGSKRAAENDISDLREQKIAVLAILHREQIDAFEERAAIMEYEGGMPREESEKKALVDVLKNAP